MSDELQSPVSKNRTVTYLLAKALKEMGEAGQKDMPSFAFEAPKGGKVYGTGPGDEEAGECTGCGAQVNLSEAHVVDGPDGEPVVLCSSECEPEPARDVARDSRDRLRFRCSVPA